jgi:endonuclease/exonuclease/phosphatase family metal-dependent hydrolase
MNLRRLILAALAALALAGTALLPAQDEVFSTPLPSGSTFKVMSWNLEHFTDDYDDPYVSSDMEDQSSKTIADREHIALAIRRANADFIVFQEAEGEAQVGAFVKLYLADMGYTTVAAVRGETWYQNLVFVSRVPIRRITTLKTADLPIVGTQQVQRKLNNRIVMAEIQVTPEYRAFVVGLHLKAGRTDEDRGARFGQIDAVHELIAETMRAHPDANVFVLGDMNFHPGEPEFLRLTQGDTELVSLFKDAGYPRTHPADGPSRHIDMILVNRNMLAEYIPGTAAVAMPLPRETMMQSSDHLPVVASFDTAAE